ncbi:hypothetical protein VTK56DRAFT_3323 [Thermocarpiscus australiensis]
MPERRDSLSPPVRRDTIDPGAHELAEASDSEEHYSDAQSGPVSPARASPIPRTRVERVDDKPAYGEVPGTKAYRMREEDAAPDEIAIIPDPSDPPPAEPEPERVARPPTPGGRPIPKTVVEEAPDAEGAVTHPEIEQRHKSDPHPDFVVKADGQTVAEGGAANDAPISPSLNTPPTPARSRRKSSLAKRPPLSPASPAPGNSVSASESGNTAVEEGDGGDGEFADDFDDFEEGGNDGDFGDFDDGFQQAEGTPVPAPQPPPAPAAPALSFPVPSFDDLDPAEIHSLTSPYLDALFPAPTDSSALPPTPTLSAKDNPVFLTPRSASLWAQLVAPPPLQPPDWIRSRIRRLFLVSLGVPVDLDEILPASSKQKKLVLPSLRRGDDDEQQRDVVRGVGGASATTAAGIDERGSAKGDSSSPSLSGVAAGKGRSSKADGEAARTFDVVSARQLCVLTDAALAGMTDEELRAHVKRLEAMLETAREVLAYWQKRTDEKIGDREAFEGVIENLVKHARKVRK